jgi:hypothetical protein
MTTTAAIAVDSLVKANARAVAFDFECEAVILHLDTGIYFGLNPVGNDIWNYLQSERSIEEIILHLLSEYKVDRGRCESELMALLQKMADQNLVIIQPL